MDELKPKALEYSKTNKASKSDDVPKKKLESVVSGPVKTKKKGELQKLADVFISEDINNVKAHLLEDIVIPTIKKAIVDLVSDGISILFYGNSGRSKASNASKVSYSGYYKTSQNSNRPEKKERNTLEYNNIIVSSRGEAEEIFVCLEELISQYGFASVADLYELVDKTAPYTASNYGWTDISSAGVKPVREGYLLCFPKIAPID